MSKIKKNTISAIFYGIIFWFGIAIGTTIVEMKMPSLGYLLGLIAGSLIFGVGVYYICKERDNKKTKISNNNSR